jgi:aminoglycoside phosphotransferase family enzyme
MTQPYTEIVEFLRRPEHYPARPRRIAVIETHFAWVFLAGSLAYKLKEPVRQDCMDYRSIAARQQGCRNEVRLNRRLAPGVYLGTVPITRSRDGSLKLGCTGSAPVVDWLIKMRRLPAGRMLDQAILRQGTAACDVQRIAARLTRFFSEATPRPSAPRRYLARLRRRILQDRRALWAADVALDKPHLETITSAQLAFLDEHPSVLAQRAARLIDGHGDLRPEHVYLGLRSVEPCVIDCLEFRSNLRWLDPAEEMAFLVLECRRLGAGRVAKQLLAAYRELTPAPPEDSLLFFYMSLRALTRAKLAAWHLHDPQFARQAASWRARANSYLADADHYIRAARAGEQEQGRFRCAGPQANARAAGRAIFRPTGAPSLGRTRQRSRAQSISAPRQALAGSEGFRRCRS